MSFQANRRQSQPDDGGYALPIVIVVIAVGAMVAIALLGYAAALLKAGADDADSLRHLYAADAGITAMRDQRERKWDTGPMEFMFGDNISVKVGITPAPAPPAPLPNPTPQPIDPRVLVPDTLDEPYPITIKSVPPDLLLHVRWEYASSTSTPPSIRLEAEETPIATSEPCTDYPQDTEFLGCQWVSYEVQDTGGDLTIVFDPGTVKGLLTLRGHPPTYPNEDSRTPLGVIAAPGGSSLNPGAHAGQVLGSLPGLPTYHTVESKADAVTVTAYIRQIPQWCLDDSSDDLDVERTYERCDDVTILSWKPYPPDEDENP